MLFSSPKFLFLFLPLSLGVFYWLANKVGKNAAFFWLTIVSIFFYASWQRQYLWLLAASMIFNFVTAKLVEKSTHYKFGIVTFGVLSNVVLLLYYKMIVAGLLSVGSASAAFSTTKDIVIPLAISFITFQQIAFLIDVYHGKLSKINAIEYCLFLTFFPQLIMGPIVHYRELISQFRNDKTLKWCHENFSLGLSIFIIGLFKKVVIADEIAPYVNQVYQALEAGKDISPADAWGAILGFQFQLYFDFSGYADMAIGLGRMFNIHLPLNFDSPYRALNRFDYWRRWHISFGAFMRQYVFSPLARSKRFKVGKIGALVLTTMLSGFWHGLGATFILWGAMQSVIMLIVHYRNALLEKIGFRKGDINLSWIAMILAFTTTLLLGVLFRSPNLSICLKMYKGLTGLFVDSSAQITKIIDGDIIQQLIVMALIVWCLPNVKSFFGAYWQATDQRQSIPKNTMPSLLPFLDRLRFKPNKFWAMAFTILFIISLLSVDETTRFIYYQF